MNEQIRKLECNLCKKISHTKKMTNGDNVCLNCIEEVSKEIEFINKLSNVFGIKNNVITDLIGRYSLSVKKIFVPEKLTPILIKNYEHFDLFDYEEVDKNLKSNDDIILIGLMIIKDNYVPITMLKDFGDYISVEIEQNNKSFFRNLSL